MKSKVEKRVYVANKFLEVINQYEILKPQHIPKGFSHSFFTLSCTIEKKGINWIEFRDKFSFRRGRINCSLNDDIGWRWLGIQFSLEQS